MSLLFPSGYKCIVCGSEIPKSRYELCDKCYGLLPFIKSKVCEKCGRPINDDSMYCNACINHEVDYDKCIAVFEFRPPVDNLVYRLKYDSEKYLAYSLSNFLIDKLKSSGIKYDVVIPVPLYFTREIERGFNQSELLISEFENNGIKTDCSCLVRTKDTISQTHLTRKEREQNTIDAFKVINKSHIKGKSVVLVDDVFTTGSTFNSIAKVLLKAGALHVYGLSVGHAVNKID